ncbi:MAG: hypothetical protein EXR62_14385 [Chloroflexi bacterium]|nr:hypothetical protein [Chloroflexota bacterium]
MSEEFLVHNPVLRDFVFLVNRALAISPNPVAVMEQIRPDFFALLADSRWLPAAYQEPSSNPGMGGNIGQWLLYRKLDGSLSLFSLVVPPGIGTPIHDHLAWGIVGLYRGEQEEEIFVHEDDGSAQDHARLTLLEKRIIKPGDFYTLTPPVGDIHRVRTISTDPSVSIHLLGNDTGCVWRHKFELEEQKVIPFRSGYTNRDCPAS